MKFTLKRSSGQSDPEATQVLGAAAEPRQRALVIALLGVLAVAVVAASYLLFFTGGASDGHTAGATTPIVRDTPGPTPSVTPTPTPTSGFVNAGLRDPFKPLIVPAPPTTSPIGAGTGTGGTGTGSYPSNPSYPSYPGYPGTGGYVPPGTGGYPLPGTGGMPTTSPTSPSAAITISVISVADDSMSALVKLDGERTTIKPDQTLLERVKVLSIMTPTITLQYGGGAFDLAVGQTRTLK